MSAPLRTTVIAIVVLLGTACSAPTFDIPEYNANAGAPSDTAPPACDQECQDYGMGLALTDTLWLLYNQNIAHRPVPPAGFDASIPCPLGGNAHVTGTLSVSGGVTNVELTYALSACSNSDSFYSFAFTGSVLQRGSFDGEDFSAVTLTGAEVVATGALTWLDDPEIDETCAVSVTQEQNSSDETLDGRVCGRNFSSETAFDRVGSGDGNASGGAGGHPTGAGGSGSVSASGNGCPSVYDGTYIGQFAYDYETPGPMPTQGTASFNLTLTLQCTGVAGGLAVLTVSHANASHPYFGCGVAGCTPGGGSVAVLPADPPTTPSHASQSGAGFVVNFPNGVILGTANQAGELNATSGGAILSNSVGGGTMTWSAASISSISAFPGDGNRIVSFKSWSMSKSAL